MSVVDRLQWFTDPVLGQPGWELTQMVVMLSEQVAKNCRTRSSATRRQSIGWQPLIGSWPTPPPPPLVSPDCVGVAEVRTALMPVALPRVRPARAQSTFAPMTVKNRTRTRSVGCSHPRSPVFHLSISCISINRMSINYLVLS